MCNLQDIMQVDADTVKMKEAKKGGVETYRMSKSRSITKSQCLAFSTVPNEAGVSFTSDDSLTLCNSPFVFATTNLLPPKVMHLDRADNGEWYVVLSSCSVMGAAKTRGNKMIA